MVTNEFRCFLEFHSAGKHVKTTETWYASNLGEAIYGGDQILDQSVYPRFQDLYAQAGAPADMAVFTRLESEGRLHCELVVYFSPAAGAVAQVCEGEPCEKPARAGLKLFAGDDRAWSALFPEAGR